MSTAAMDRLRAEITEMRDAAASAATLISSLSAQLRDALAKANDDGDDAALTEFADSLDQQQQTLAAAIVANTPADPEADPTDDVADTPQPAPAAADYVNPDTAPMMSGGIAPAAHAASPAQPPATEPVNTNPAEPTNIGGIGPAAGLSPVENLPAALQPGDDAPVPVEAPVLGSPLDPTVRSDSPTSTQAAFPNADPAANHIDPESGEAIVAPPGVDVTTGADIPRVDVLPVDVVRDETTDAPVTEPAPGADVPFDPTSASEFPGEGPDTGQPGPVSPPVIDPNTGLPVQLDPVTSAPVVAPTDAPSDLSDATSAANASDGTPL